MNLIKKASIATALAATAIVSASPAMARDHHRGDDTAAVAIGAGIIGLALGAIIASSDDDRHDRDWRRRGWEYRDGYYWDRQGRRYDRNGRRFYNDNYHARRGYRSERGFYRGY